MIECDGATGVIRAGADVRGYRYALAWYDAQIQARFGTRQF